MSLVSLVFSAIFWQTVHSEAIFFGSQLLSLLLSNNTFILIILSLYCLFFNLGFGPMKHTLLCELFSPREQVNILGGLYPSSHWPDLRRWPGQPLLLVSKLPGHQDVPPARGNLRSSWYISRGGRQLFWKVCFSLLSCSWSWSSSFSCSCFYSCSWSCSCFW